MIAVLLAITIICITLGQILQKVAADELAGGHASRPLLFRFLTNKKIWLAIFFLAFGLATWLLALTQTEVSKAYPILSLSFVVTSLFARLALSERITVSRWVGIGLITAGAALVSVS